MWVLLKTNWETLQLWKLFPLLWVIRYNHFVNIPQMITHIPQSNITIPMHSLMGEFHGMKKSHFPHEAIQQLSNVHEANTHINSLPFTIDIEPNIQSISQGKENTKQIVKCGGGILIFSSKRSPYINPFSTFFLNSFLIKWHVHDTSIWQLLGKALKVNKLTINLFTFSHNTCTST